MSLISGITYNLRGMWLGVRTPKLLFLGLARFFVIMILSIVSTGLFLYYHEQILAFIWTPPDNPWLVWLWQFLSWLLSILLGGIAALFAYLLSQILFSVVIMDFMSQITERIITGQTQGHIQQPFFKHFFYLMRQEIPRAILPVLASLVLMVFGWFTPFGPVFTILSTLAAVTFLAWDNTDLVPARRFQPFGKRFRFLMRNLPFHIGFGLLFIIPVFNILSLSFAPVGGTLYYFESLDGYDKAIAAHGALLRGDIPNFTNVMPIRQISEILE